MPVFWLIISIPVLFVIAPYAYEQYRNFMVFYYSQLLSGKMPHRVMDNLLEWKSDDKIKLIEHSLYEDPETHYVYYQGVTDHKEFVFSKHQHSDIYKKVEISNFLGKFEYENLDLKDRLESKESVKEELEESRYNQFLQETREQLRKMEDEFTQDELPSEEEIRAGTDSETNKSQNQRRTRNKV